MAEVSRIVVNKSSIDDIADAIRTKTGSSDTYALDEMPAAIESIAGGTAFMGLKTNFLVIEPIISNTYQLV